MFMSKENAGTISLLFSYMQSYMHKAIIKKSESCVFKNEKISINVFKEYIRYILK